MMKKIVILFFIFLVTCIWSPATSQAAILYSQAANQDVYEGQTFVLDWFLDTEGKSVNSYDLKINFSKDILEVTEASTGNSLINLWIKYPSYDNSKGHIELTGGIANGVNSTQVPIFRSVFRAVKSGTAAITVDPSSIILLNDGRGTAENLKVREVFFNIYPESFKPLLISSSSHPDQNMWYSTRDVLIEFEPKSGTVYSYSFSSNIDIFPDDIEDEVPQAIAYNSQADGIYYFKVNSKVGDSTWQEQGVYRVQIDATAPEEFTPLIGVDENILGGKSFLSFSTLDKTSGISHYNIKHGLLGFWKQATSPHELQRPIVGNHIKVAAIDNAGNKRIETIEYKGWMPVWVFVVLIILLMTVVMSLVMSFRKHAKK